ncbi:amidohydrolase [Kitasatospora sp. NPDC059571]|uniref:amidohydrolase n=1 Tax=Kitasatospora sp. NPDC059571 TaxID=3346871 RepID=UPI00369E8B4C
MTGRTQAPPTTAATAHPPAPPGPAPVLEAVPEVSAPAVALCLDVHHRPELSGTERRTAALLAERLATTGYRTATGIGGHGVVGVLRNGPGPVVMLRAELDALPIREESDLPYAATATAEDADGRAVAVAHACGHDVHLACAAGAADLLARAADRWSGTLLVVGQPAEETLEGARAMLSDGLYERFGAPDTVLAQHTAPLPAGMVAHGSGPLLAASTLLEITVHGRGGHAGTPQLAVDPVLTAAALVMRLQAVVPRETSPAEHAVLTVGSLHAGSRGNIIPDTAVLEVSVRACSEETLDRIAAAVRRIAAAECAASDCPQEPTVRVLSRTPATVCDPVRSEEVRRAHRAVFGPERVAVWPPSPATEDFPLYGPAGAHLHGSSQVRTAYWMLGATGPRQWAEAPGRTAAEKLAALPPNHSPRFRADLRLAVPTGITALATAALGCLTTATDGNGGAADGN